ncbi:c-type cytochrome [Caenispirillum salinarum]|uniref:c-type cytochrome n=1 Tax=Caenispirillum salinarum TaxID=859058 RepID=UPI00384BFA81
MSHRSTLILTGLLALSTAGPAAAQDAGPAQRSAETLAALCALCHAPGGIEGLDEIRSPEEFAEEMRELVAEPGEHRLMALIAKGFSDAEIAALADHFAARRAAEHPAAGEDGRERHERLEEHEGSEREEEEHD